MKVLKICNVDGEWAEVTFGPHSYSTSQPVEVNVPHPGSTVRDREPFLRSNDNCLTGEECVALIGRAVNLMAAIWELENALNATT